MSKSRTRQQGVLLIEILVTMIIVVLGLLGLAGLQVQMQKNEMESYQRSQALLLLSDMANRIATNRNAAAAYVTSSPLGAGMTCSAATTTVAQRDLGEWCEALKGNAETTVANANVGAVVGGRGCVEIVGGDYLVTVAWQGLTPISAPPASVTCGAGSYNGTTGSACVDDRCRRTVTSLVRIANLNP